jgi:impB/mucB/samB family C-terminal domain
VTVKVKFADFQQATRIRSFPAVIRRHDLLRQSSVELVRSLLPTAKGVRLLGVTYRIFEAASADTDDALPLFGLARSARHPSPSQAHPDGTALRAAPTCRSTAGMCPNGWAIA